MHLLESSFLVNSTSTSQQKQEKTWAVCVPQSVVLLTSAQVMISLFMSLSPTWGLLLSVQSPLWILCLPLSLSLPCSHALHLKTK